MVHGPYTRIRAAVMALALGLAILPANAVAIPNPFFVGRWQSHSDLSAFTKWTSVMPRYQQESCDGDMCQKWQELLTLLQGKSAKQQIDAVNTFFNAVTYIEDNDNYSMNDYWATPQEMMKRGADCEDYAIAKYISLKRLGVSESNMRIMIVQDNNLGGIMHAILEVKLNGTAYLLDNQVKQVVEAQKIFHYRPIYAINTHNWWAYQ